MTKVFNLYEAKNQLSSLVDRAASGEEIVIAKHGQPMAKLVPLPVVKKGPRTPFSWVRQEILAIGAVAELARVRAVQTA